MKKVIVASVAALGMAVLPVAGVFAANSSVQDTVTLTVGSGCTMRTTNDNNAGGVYNLGSTTANTGGVLGGEAGIKGTDMYISCNSENGWTLAVNAEDLTDGAKKIEYGAFVESGAKSVWSLRLQASEGIDLGTGYDDFKVAHDGLAVPTGGNYILNGKITPYYKAYVASDQQSGTYSGNVTYTFVDLGNN